jgi:simple sugar transport system ATP-binding protein
MTVTENVALGWNELGHPVRAQQCAKLIVDASRTYGLEVDPDAKVGQLSYGSRQRVEIVKSIIRGADLLVLDEPTSNLSPRKLSNFSTSCDSFENRESRLFSFRTSLVRF